MNDTLSVTIVYHELASWTPVVFGYGGRIGVNLEQKGLERRKERLTETLETDTNEFDYSQILSSRFTSCATRTTRRCLHPEGCLKKQPNISSTCSG